MVGIIPFNQLRVLTTSSLNASLPRTLQRRCRNLPLARQQKPEVRPTINETSFPYCILQRSILSTYFLASVYAYSLFVEIGIGCLYHKNPSILVTLSSPSWYSVPLAMDSSYLGHIALSLNQGEYVIGDMLFTRG
jgi:hypothetical protein